MVLAAMLVEPISARLRLPFSALLVLIGFAASELITGLGFDTGLRHEDFVALVLHVLVPMLVFESAFHMSLRGLLKNLLPVLLLAVPFMLLAAALTGVTLYWGINHPGFPLMAALLTGTILSATDPVAVVALFQKLHAPQRLSVLLEGESLFNDATAVVVFGLLVGLMLHPSTSLSASQVALDFSRHFVGGVVFGLALGLIAGWLYSRSARLEWISIIALLLPPLAYVLAEQQLHVSGIVTVLCAGLMLGEAHRQSRADAFVSNLWQVIAYAANAIVFLLVGVTMTVGMFTSHWLAMLIGIGAATLARLLNVYVLLRLCLKLPGQAPLGRGYPAVLQWGGLRGAVALALALSLPTEIQGWYSIQSIVYGVVVFTLFVQAPLMAPLVRKAVASAPSADAG